MNKKLITDPQPYLFNLTQMEERKKGEPRKEVADAAFEMVDALTGPILTFSTAWADTIPSRLLELVPTARMLALMKQEQTATYPECAIYLYTRSLEAPMDSDWTHIYTHVSCSVLQQYYKEDHWQEVQAPRQLNEWQLHKLNDLRRHIYTKRRQIVKSNVREARPKETSTLPSPPKASPSDSQPSLFQTPDNIA